MTRYVDLLKIIDNWATIHKNFYIDKLYNFLYFEFAYLFIFATTLKEKIMQEYKDAAKPKAATAQVRTNQQRLDEIQVAYNANSFVGGFYEVARLLLLERTENGQEAYNALLAAFIDTFNDETRSTARRLMPLIVDFTDMATNGRDVSTWCQSQNPADLSYLLIVLPEDFPVSFIEPFNIWCNSVRTQLGQMRAALDSLNAKANNVLRHQKD